LYAYSQSVPPKYGQNIHPADLLGGVNGNIFAGGAICGCDKQQRSKKVDKCRMTE